jgi:hypothetical protein
MFYNDRSPPHFHALYGEFEATIDIEALNVLEGQIPRRALDLVLDWAEIHRGDPSRRSIKVVSFGKTGSGRGRGKVSTRSCRWSRLGIEHVLGRR